MEGINIRLVCWEDGEKIEKDLDCTDRWTLHSAVELQVGCQQLKGACSWGLPQGKCLFVWRRMCA